MIEVVTVWTPRPQHEKWRDYLPLLRLQKLTAEKFGHEHVVISDADIPGFNVMRADLPESLMKAMIVGVTERLRRHSKHDLLFVDADCLVARDLTDAFGPEFDIRLTRRISEKAPVNNGAMYVPKRCNLAALRFFEHALTLCGDHWGADQEAISQAASVVPNVDICQNRRGARVEFRSMRDFNSVPKVCGVRHKSNPYVVHFKGETKDWAETYAERFIL